MEASDKLFVYGTLLNQIENPYSYFLRSHCKYLGPGYFPGNLYDVGHYPGAIYDSRSDEKVFGDIILLENTEEVFKKLDAYEGVGLEYAQPNEYLRKVVEVFMEDQTLKCWAYLYNHSVYRLKKIDSGNYVQYLQNRHK